MPERIRRPFDVKKTLETYTGTPDGKIESSTERDFLEEKEAFIEEITKRTDLSPERIQTTITGATSAGTTQELAEVRRDVLRETSRLDADELRLDHKISPEELENFYTKLKNAKTDDDLHAIRRELDIVKGGTKKEKSDTQPTPEKKEKENDPKELEFVRVSKADVPSLSVPFDIYVVDENADPASSIIEPGTGKRLRSATLEEDDERNKRMRAGKGGTTRAFLDTPASTESSPEAPDAGKKPKDKKTDPGDPSARTSSASFAAKVAGRPDPVKGKRHWLRGKMPRDTARAYNRLDAGKERRKSERERARERVIADAQDRILETIRRGGTKDEINHQYRVEREKLAADEIRDLNISLQVEEKILGRSFGINYEAETPLERLQRAKKTFRRAGAGTYFESGNTRRPKASKLSWKDFKPEYYKGIEPLSLEKIRGYAWHAKLFGELLQALQENASLDVLERVQSGQPLTEEQRKFLLFAQYEFTRQLRRAEKLDTEFTLEEFKKIVDRDPLLNQTARMMGVEKMHEFFKTDFYHLAMTDRAMFNRFAGAFKRRQREDAYRIPGIRLASHGQWAWPKTKANAERDEMAAALGAHLKMDPDRLARMQKEALTGSVTPGPSDHGPQKREDVERMKAELALNVSEKEMQDDWDQFQTAFRTPDGRPWKFMSDDEREAVFDEWVPPKAAEYVQGTGRGLWARISYVIARIFLNEKKKNIVRKDI